jgi:hypothetical protein
MLLEFLGAKRTFLSFYETLGSNCFDSLFYLVLFDLIILRLIVLMSNLLILDGLTIRISILRSR